MASSEKSSLEALARRLRDCAESLSESAQRLKLAAGRQKEFVKKINELNLRIRQTIAEMKRAGEVRRAGDTTPPPAPKPSKAAPMNDVDADGNPIEFIDLTEYLSQHTEPKPPKTASEMTYIEAMEFSGPGEFARFRNQPPISDDDIASCDIDQLLWRLADPDSRL